MDVRTYRKIHRYLGLVIGAQLILWTAGGLFFSLNPIAKVRGETEAPEPARLPTSGAPPLPAGAIAQLVDETADTAILSVLLRPHLGSSVYEIAYLRDGETHWALANPSTGNLREPVGRDEAVEIATRAYLPASSIAEVALITESGSGSEYRERPLPAYRVAFDDPRGTRLYVSVERGQVTARRNHRWRLFDFLWMLHIMDYQSRDDFNTLLLRVVSALGLVTVLSGFALFSVTSPQLRRMTSKR